jgi:hypothetical protein
VRSLISGIGEKTTYLIDDLEMSAEDFDRGILDLCDTTDDPADARKA